MEVGLLTALRATTSAGSAGSAGKFQTPNSAADVYRKIDFGAPWRVNFQAFPRKGHKGPQGDPKGAKESPRAPQDAHKAAQREPKRAQREPRHPKGSPRAPKGPGPVPTGRPLGPLWSHFVGSLWVPWAPLGFPLGSFWGHGGPKTIYTNSRSTAQAAVMLSWQ